jgi:MFS family permease
MNTAKRALLVAFIAWALAAMDQSLFGYAVPGMMQEFGIGIEAVGVLISASFVFGMVAPIFAGVLADRWGPRLLLCACLGVSSLLVFAQGLAPTLLSFSVLRILSYGLSGALSPITSAMVANTAPAKHRALYIAILQAAYPFGWFLAALAVVPMAGDDWRNPFNIALLVVPVAIALYFVMDAPAKSGGPAPAAAGAPSPISPLRTLFSPSMRRTTLLASLAFFLYGGAVGGVIFYLPTFFQQGRGHSASIASLVVGLTYAIAMVGYIAAAIVSTSRLGPRRTTILWSATGALLLLGSLWVPPDPVRDVVLYGIAAIFFFGTSSILTNYALDVFEPAIRNTAIAVCGTASLTLGYIVFPMLVATSVESIGWAMSFSLIVVPATLLTSFILTLLPETSRDPA